ncbi:MAG: SOS response-associated peptidase [Deltaproteobacteria bacterium]|nr:SOS response-associated peptidase [Deltaproteobacteria bacterium]
MCGRYTLTRQERLVEELEASLGEAPQSEWWKARFNVAPTQPAPVVVLREGGRRVEMMRWGLVPHWAGNGGKPPLMINARVESVQDKPMFRDALQRRRCLVPADGFFEWKHEGQGKSATKQPMYMHRPGNQLFAFAGLWARLRTDQGEQLSFAIVTGPPNDLVAPIHDRMPIVLDPSTYAAWLDPALDADGARALLGVPPVGDWIAEPVSPRVNSAANDDSECIAPVTAQVAVQGSLFPV